MTANNQGGVFVDFDNTVQHFTFGNGGSFNFFVNDVSLNAGKTIAFSGTILVIEPRQTEVLPETRNLRAAPGRAGGPWASWRGVASTDGPAIEEKGEPGSPFSMVRRTGHPPPCSQSGYA